MKKEEISLLSLLSSSNTEHIASKKDLEQVVQEFIHNMNEIWFKHSKIVNITKYLKLWWNDEY